MLWLQPIIALVGIATIGQSAAFPQHHPMPTDFSPFKKKKEPVATTTEGTDCIRKCVVFKDWCQNGGTCVDTTCNQFKCICKKGFTGSTCDTRLSDLTTFENGRKSERRKKNGSRKGKADRKVTTTLPPAPDTTSRKTTTVAHSSTSDRTGSTTAAKEGQQQSRQETTTVARETTTIATETTKVAKETTTIAQGTTTDPKVTTTVSQGGKPDRKVIATLAELFWPRSGNPTKK